VGGRKWLGATHTASKLWMDAYPAAFAIAAAYQLITVEQVSSNFIKLSSISNF
jgi:hypothetical protein